MDEPHLDPALHHPVQHLQKRHHVTTTNIDVHILDVRSGSCDRYAAHSLRSFGQPDRLRRQANVAIHNLSLACGTIPQTTEVNISRLEMKVVIVVLLSLYVIASFSIKEPSQFLYWRKCLS